ncbi:MAG: DMT family transporter [Chitinophagales bacterium]|nr:DMT family transporter [Chitinophagales bacterium]
MEKYTSLLIHKMESQQVKIQTTTTNEFARGFLMVIIGAACLSTKAIFVKLSLQYGVDAITTLMFRMLFALPYYLFVVIFSSKIHLKHPLQYPWIKLSLIGLSGYYFASLFDFIGLQYVQANLERLIVFIYPTIVLMLGAWIFKRKITWIQTIATCTTYIGIFIAFLSQDFALNDSKAWLGIFYIVMCAVTFALYLVYSDNLIKEVGVVAFNAISMLIATLAVFIHFGIKYGIHLTGYDYHVYIYGICLGVVATIIPTLAFAKGIQLIGSANTAIISTFGPVATILMTYFILNEPFSFLQGVGTFFVLCGVLILGLKGHKAQKNTEENKQISHT